MRGRTLILGGGYVGRRLGALLLRRGVVVSATTRSEARARELAALGMRALLVDVTQPVTLAAMRGLLGPGTAEPADPLDVYWLIPPGREAAAAVMGDGLDAVCRALRGVAVRRAVLASSSAVYGDHGGATIVTDTPARPTGARATLLHDAEQRWLQGGDSRRVVRLAGLYGPGRVPGLKAVAAGGPLLGDPDAWLNLLHADDAAALLAAVADSDGAAPVELGAATPVRRLDYYAHLAARLGVAAPRPATDAEAEAMGLDPARVRRSASKALDMSPTTRRVGWSPRWPDPIAGVDAVLDAAAAATRE